MEEKIQYSPIDEVSLSDEEIENPLRPITSSVYKDKTPSAPPPLEEDEEVQTLSLPPITLEKGFSSPDATVPSLSDAEEEIEEEEEEDLSFLSPSEKLASEKLLPQESPSFEMKEFNKKKENFQNDKTQRQGFAKKLEKYFGFTENTLIVFDAEEGNKAISFKEENSAKSFAEKIREKGISDRENRDEAKSVFPCQIDETVYHQVFLTAEEISKLQKIINSPSVAQQGMFKQGREPNSQQQSAARTSNTNSCCRCTLF